MKPKPDFDPDFVVPSRRSFPLGATCGLLLLLVAVAGSAILSFRRVRAHHPISQVAVPLFWGDHPPIRQTAPGLPITVIAPQPRGHSIQQTAPRAPITTIAPQPRDHFVVMSNTAIDQQMIHRPP